MELYDSYTVTAIKYCEGDVQKADYFLNCSVYMYYYRLKQKKEYADWMQDQIKNKGKTND